jgi:hypothetical protein
MGSRVRRHQLLKSITKVDCYVISGEVTTFYTQHTSDIRTPV